MIYLINTFNPHWEGQALPEWTWPKRRVFGYMLKLIDGPLSLGIGGLRRIGKTTLLKQLVGELSANRVPAKRICYFQFDRDIVLKDDKERGRNNFPNYAPTCGSYFVPVPKFPS